MILIMVTAWIPPGKGAEAAEKYMEVMKKIPQASFEKPLMQAASTVAQHGIEVYRLARLKEENMKKRWNLP